MKITISKIDGTTDTVDADPIKLKHSKGLKFFIHETYGEWNLYKPNYTITEYSSGCSLRINTNRKTLIRDCEKALKKRTLKYIISSMKKTLKKNGQKYPINK